MLLHAVAAPDGVHGGDALLACDVVLAFEVALVEDAAREADTVDDDVACEGLA